MQTSRIATNGIELSVTQAGDGPPVLLCHGFPETARSWRRQIAHLAANGFRAIAPDMRGYGLSSAPTDPALYTQLHIVGDLVGLLDSLGLPHAAIVGHDWGAITTWNAALMRPDRFPRIAALSVPYVPRGDLDLIAQSRRPGQHFYMLDFIDPRADAALGFDVAGSLLGSYYTASGSAPDADRWDPYAAPGKRAARPDTLPTWLDRDDYAHAVAAFTSSGFTGGLNYYRAIPSSFELLAPFKGAKIQQPSLFIAGTRDAVIDFSRPYVDALRQTAPGLTETILIDGAGHWVQQEAPERVNDALLSFLRH